MGTRTSQSSFPFNQGGGGGSLLPYPRSPALFGSNGVFLFTPQPMTPRLNGGGGGMLQDGTGNFGGYMQQGGDTYGRQGYASQTAFPFPDLTQASGGGMTGGEVKTETSPGQGLHKPHPVQAANGPMTHPYGSVAGYDGTNFSGTVNSVPLSHDQQANTNNNNSTMSVADISSIAATCSQQMMNPIQQNPSFSYMSRILQGAIPPSPGFLMTHSCKLMYSVLIII